MLTPNADTRLMVRLLNYIRWDQTMSTISHPPRDDSGIVTKPTAASVAETVSRLVAAVNERGMTLFAVIDQRAEAGKVGLHLRETTAVLFGNPRAGTPVMDASPLAALDLPLKVVVWDDGTHTNVSYVATATLAARYGLAAEVAGNLSGIDGLTDDLVGRRPS
jgi:uncharacterized protein (DUF302 family)